ncbi:hypothetical protein C6500_11550 [Candidatus Poribacteria bacterium]|nr:MAG: hypothetical protein C6500_11550 [Candidatus Poribacteria bacterium]
MDQQKIKRGQQVLDSDYSEFSATDPFNPQNHVEGQVSFSRDTRYGSLKIKKINGESVDQPQICGTPKIAYPFGLGHNYRFPSAERIYRFRKYDGTNIFMYRYRNNGIEYITFKGRLFPFLRGRYITMWQYILRKYSQITALFKMNPNVTGFSFELYGSDNPHMIQYEDVKLDIVLLFGLRGTQGQIVLNTEIEAGDIPKAERLGTVEKDYVWHYEQEQQELDRQLGFLGLNESHEPMFRGEEGSIWYVKLKDSHEIRMYKCKPHRIEQVHWTQTQTQLSAPVIWATILKAFENWENPELDEIIAILNEDYPIHQIEISIEQIQQMLHTAKNAVDTRKKIWELMVMHAFNSNTDPATVFHKIANQFDQDKRIIYKAIKNVQKMMQIQDE